MKHLTPRALLALAVALLSASFAASPALGCSPPFEPSLRKLGPEQVVVLGTIGQRVANGRHFHVERWFNGGVPAPTIVIAFQEGEPIGDCSYLVSAGQRLIIAPGMDGALLTASIATLQAEPESDQGRIYLQEAHDLYGPGVVLAPVIEPTQAVAPSQPAVPTEPATPAAPAESPPVGDSNVPGPFMRDAEPLIALLVGLAIAGLLGATFLRARRQSE